MKLPLKYGIPLLVLLWLASGYTAYGEGKTLLMMLAMGVALWTAFSLPRPRRRPPEPPEEDEEELPPEIPVEPEPPANGSGRRTPPTARHGDRT